MLQNSHIKLLVYKNYKESKNLRGKEIDNWENVFLSYFIFSFPILSKSLTIW